MAAETKLRDTDLAYIAGLFDGEGCINIGRNRSNRHHWLRIEITMASEYIPTLLLNYFGGSFYDWEKNLGKSQQLRLYSWQIRSRKAYTFLKTIYPYLRLKRAQADLAFIFQEGFIYQGSKPLTDEVLAVREAQRILMHNLKKEVV